MEVRGLQNLVAGTLAVLFLLFAVPGASADITQLAGGGGCVVAPVVSGCTSAPVGSPSGIVVAGDNVYVASQADDTIRIYDRAGNGSLVPRGASTSGCIADDGAGTGCADARGLDGPGAMALNKDGTRLYVTASVSKGVVVLDRNKSTGKLTQSTALTSCLTQSGSAGACSADAGMGSPASIALSPDGDNVYVAGAAASGTNNGFVDALDVVSSGISQHPVGSGGCAENVVVTAGCADARAMSGAQQVRVPPDGGHVYVTSNLSNAVTVFLRGTGGRIDPIVGPAGCLQMSGAEGCTSADLLGTEVFALAFVGNNRAYVGSTAGAVITLLNRNPATGALSVPGPCVSSTTTGPLAACTDSVDLFGLSALAVSPSHRHLFVGARYGRGMIEFNLAGDGSPVPVPAPGGCIATGGASMTSPCAVPRGFARVNGQDFGALGIALDKTGRDLYGVSFPIFEDQAGIVAAQVSDDEAPVVKVKNVKCGDQGDCKIAIAASDAGGSDIKKLTATLKFTKHGHAVTKHPKVKRHGGGFQIAVKLAPGRYKLSVVATDGDGNGSKPAKKTFKVK